MQDVKKRGVLGAEKHDRYGQHNRTHDNLYSLYFTKYTAEEFKEQSGFNHGKGILRFLCLFTVLAILLYRRKDILYYNQVFLLLHVHSGILLVCAEAKNTSKYKPMP